MKAMNKIDKYLKKLNKLEFYGASTLLMILLAICFCNVVFRLIGRPLMWADEAQRFIMIWMTFLACPVLVSRKSHIVVDLVSSLFPQKIHKAMYLIGDIMLIVFLLFLLPYTVQMSAMNMISKSSAMRLPMGYIYLCMPIGIFLSIISQAHILAKLLLSKEEVGVTK